MKLRCSDAHCLVSACWTPWWQLLPELVIGGQAHRIPPLTLEAWKAKKSHFDGRTGRTWPNAQLSARARFTQVRLGKCHPNKGRVFVKHCSDGQN